MNQRHYYKELRMQQFRSLVQTARHGSFTAAARELNLSRTSVWQQIRALEDDFGVELVVVVDHQPQLTAEGQLLFKILSPVVDEFDGLKEFFLSQLNLVKQKLTIATTTSLLNFELREPTAEFRKKFPDVSLSFVDRTSAAATTLLTTAKADLAVVGRTSGMLEDKNLEIVQLMTCPYVLGIRKDHPLAAAKKLRLEDLAEHPLILPSAGANSRQRIDLIMNQAGHAERMQIAMQSYNTAVMLAYAEEGLGMALLSLSPRLMEMHKRKLIFQDLSKFFGNEEVILIRRKARFENSNRQHIDEFAKLIIQHLQIKSA